MKGVLISNLIVIFGGIECILVTAFGDNQKSGEKVIDKFIEENIEKAFGIKTFHSEIYERYLVFCKQKHIKPLNATWLGIEMSKRGMKSNYIFRRKKTHWGLKLK